MKEKHLRQQSICFFFFRAFYCPVMGNTYSLEVIAALLRYGEPSIWLCCMHSLLAIVVFARWPCLTIKSKCIICLGIHNWRMNISDFFTFYNNVYWNYIEYVYICIFFQIFTGRFINWFSCCIPRGFQQMASRISATLLDRHLLFNKICCIEITIKTQCGSQMSCNGKIDQCVGKHRMIRYFL